MGIVDIWVYSGKLSLEDIFESPSQWPVQAFYAGYTFCTSTYNLIFENKKSGKSDSELWKTSD